MKNVDWLCSCNALCPAQGMPFLREAVAACPLGLQGVPDAEVKRGGGVGNVGVCALAYKLKLRGLVSRSTRLQIRS